MTATVVTTRRLAPAALPSTVRHVSISTRTPERAREDELEDAARPQAGAQDAQNAVDVTAEPAALTAVDVPVHDVRRPRWLTPRQPSSTLAMSILCGVLIAISDTLAIFTATLVWGVLVSTSFGDAVALARFILPYGASFIIPLFLMQGLYNRRAITNWSAVARAYATFLLCAGLLLTFLHYQVASPWRVVSLAASICAGLVVARAVMQRLIGVWTRGTGVAVFGSKGNLDVLTARFDGQAIYSLKHAGAERTVDEIERVVIEQKIDLVGMDAFAFDRDEIRSVQDRLEPLRVHVAALAPIFEPSQSRTALHEVQYVTKRMIDIFGAAVLLVLTSPLMLLAAIAVRVSSPGPAFYRGARIGLGGRSFDCLKFRTMYVGADLRQRELEAQNEAQGPIFKIHDDPRVTRLGRWLRACSLDELPQLWNVLRGEMSLVGPRPLPMRDCDLLTDEDQRRHSVLPGMTGLWQVTPNRHDRENEIVSLDLQYVDNWSLWTDFSILGRTIGVVFRELGRSVVPGRRATP